MKDNKKEYLRITIGDNDFTGDRELFDLLLELFRGLEKPITEESIPEIKEFLIKVWPMYLRLRDKIEYPDEAERNKFYGHCDYDKYISDHLKVEIITEDLFRDEERWCPNAEDIFIPVSPEDGDEIFVW